MDLTESVTTHPKKLKHMETKNHDGIIVLGMPRSGTTLLRRLLDAHPNIACPGETHLLNAVARFIHSEDLIEGASMGVLDGLSFAGFPEEEILERLREFAFSFSRAQATRQGKSRWAEKTAIDVFYLKEIEKVFAGHVYQICVFRHGLDVACSNLELVEKNGGYLDEFHEYVKRHKCPLLAFCHAWVDVTKELMDFSDRHPDHTVVYRYEDLVTEPEETMRRVIEFVGEDWDPNILHIAMKSATNIGFGDWKTYAKTRIETSSMRRWSHLSPAMIHRAAEVLNPTLEQLGYDHLPIRDDRDAEEARRRYELGVLSGANS